MSSAQYWAPSAWITAAVQHVVEGAALEAQTALIEAFSSSVLLDLVSHISTYPINRFMLGELAQVLKSRYSVGTLVGVGRWQEENGKWNLYKTEGSMMFFKNVLVKHRSATPVDPIATLGLEWILQWCSRFWDLDFWATVQSFLSWVQVRRLWRWLQVKGR